MYENPITMIQKTISQQMKQEEDKWVCEIEKEVGFHIDKQELIRALNYDRDQYFKGFNDAKRQFERPIGHWREIESGHNDGKQLYECSVCGKYVPTNFISEYKYCRNCGAKMEVEHD